MMQDKGFFASLFDTSFSSFVTMRIIKVIYVITLILIGLVALAFIVRAFSVGSGFGFLTLIVLAPLASLFYVIYVRVVLELVIAIFRIMEHTGEQLRLMQGQAPAPPSDWSTTTRPSSGEPPA